jgi:hypothetical protein
VEEYRAEEIARRREQHARWCEEDARRREEDADSYELIAPLERFFQKFLHIAAEIRRNTDGTSPHHEPNASPLNGPAAPTSPTLADVVQPVEVKEEVGYSIYLFCSLPFNFDPKVIRGVPESLSMIVYSLFTTLSILTVLYLAICMLRTKNIPQTPLVFGNALQ